MVPLADLSPPYVAKNHEGLLMKDFRLMLVLVLLMVGMAACAKKTALEQTAPSVGGEFSKAAAFLAYEHTVEIELPREQIAARVEAARAACSDERFGACSVLTLDVSDGSRSSARLIVRIVPSGVEPLVGVAAQDGKLGSRKTRAEDLAGVTADTVEQIEMLVAQRARLLEFRERKDLSVADMIALSSELASTETRLEASNRAAGDQRRRIETNLLTLSFGTAQVPPSRFDRVGDAFKGLVDSAADGLAEALEMLGFGIPFLILAFPLALGWRWLWRRFTRQRS
jgi:hypothetical protein